eukprot:scaffold63910_cov64-Phaeocystis_antarctica.AAC.2
MERKLPRAWHGLPRALWGRRLHESDETVEVGNGLPVELEQPVLGHELVLVRGRAEEDEAAPHDQVLRAVGDYLRGAHTQRALLAVAQHGERRLGPPLHRLVYFPYYLLLTTDHLTTDYSLLRTFSSALKVLTGVPSTASSRSPSCNASCAPLPGSSRVTESACRRSAAPAHRLSLAAHSRGSPRPLPSLVPHAVESEIGRSSASRK